MLLSSSDAFCETTYRAQFVQYVQPQVSQSNPRRLNRTGEFDREFHRMFWHQHRADELGVECCCLDLCPEVEIYRNRLYQQIPPGFIDFLYMLLPEGLLASRTAGRIRAVCEGVLQICEDGSLRDGFNRVGACDEGGDGSISDGAADRRTERSTDRAADLCSDRTADQSCEGGDTLGFDIPFPISSMDRDAHGLRLTEGCVCYKGGCERELPCRIGELEGVVVDVGVSVVGLGELGVGDGGVGLDEAGDFGVVVAGAVVVEARVLVECLARIAAGDAEGAGIVLVALRAIGVVAIAL